MMFFASTLILIIFSYVNCDRKMELIRKIEGQVDIGNYTYYNVHYPGDLLLVLTTIKGDADIYISETNGMPTFETTTYDLHSATCGNDVIKVPAHFIRPIYVGVYGYSPILNSKFQLEIHQLADIESDLFSFSNENKVPIRAKVANKNDEMKISNRRRKKKQQITDRAGIWALLEIIELIFL